MTEYDFKYSWVADRDLEIMAKNIKLMYFIVEWHEIV